MSKHTPGPWRWCGNGSYGVYGVYLATVHSGRRFIMDFVRMGMRLAQPRFQPSKGNGMIKAQDLLMFEVGDQSVRGLDGAKKNDSVYRLDVRGIDCADARLIEASPELYDLLQEVLNGSWENASVSPDFVDRANTVLRRIDGEV